MSLRKLCFFATLSTFAAVGSVNRPALNNRAQPTPLLSVQSKDTKNLSVGSLLVASRDLGDPNFAQTVVLLIRYDPQGVVGLILNRRTEVPVSRVLKDFKAAQNRSDRVYLGGPVDIPTVFGLYQSPAKIQGAGHVFDKVYLISAKPVFERALSAQPDPGIFHVYLGYGGWNRDQLQREVELGSWFIFPPDANTVFSSDPDSLWPQMIRKTELKFAGRPASGLMRYWASRVPWLDSPLIVLPEHSATCPARLIRRYLYSETFVRSMPLELAPIRGRKASIRMGNLFTSPTPSSTTFPFSN